MSVRIPFEYLDKKQINQITKDLKIVEKTQIFGNQLYSDNKKIINFYRTANNHVYLPYYYTTNLTGIHFPNNRLKKDRIESFEMSDNFELRDYQKEAIELALEDMKKNGTCFFNVFCSFGKTVVGSWLASWISKEHNLATLCIYPRHVIGKSWLGTFKNCTKAKIWKFDANIEMPDDTQIILCMDTELEKLTPKILNRIGHLIIDEAHTFCTEGNINGLLNIEPKYITALTATYERDDGFEVMLDFIVGKKRIVKISKKPFFVIHCQTPFVPVDIKTTTRGIQFNSLVDSLDNNELRNEFIYDIVYKNMSEKILIMTKHIEHVKILEINLKNILTKYNKKISTYCGNDKTYFECDVLIGTISKIGVGFDEKETCENWNGRRFNLLILSTSTKKIEQIAGRVFRSDIPIVVDIVDDHENLKRHWTDRKRWYISRNGIIHKTKTSFKWTELYHTLKNKHEKAELIHKKDSLIPLHIDETKDLSSSIRSIKKANKKADKETKNYSITLLNKYLPNLELEKKN